MSTDPYIWIAAILTLCVFSFLYKDTVAFAVVEHLLVGLSAGYMLVTYWNNVFFAELVQPLLRDGLGKEAHLWCAAILCLMWAGKYADKTKDIYRLALAFWVAVDVGLTIPNMLEADVLSQIAGTANLSFDGDLRQVVGNLVLALGTMAALFYFFFSLPHEGAFGVVAKGGTMVLMVSFGATFSYTIMSRVYLLIGRLVFLLRDWLGII
ncbi:MAG: hypothetical protein MUC50_15220 [Myxococcota bacterium]|jgi:hypothetical protein|nr:hypothetical protein [Myxococcota bacterium]